MIVQINSDYNFNSNSSNSCYDSDYSLSSNTSNSSSNTSNYSMTSDPINYYHKDNLKQNPQKFKCYSSRKQQKQNYLDKRRKSMLANYNDNELYAYNFFSPQIYNDIGYDSCFNKDTPFISYLIKKRINFCSLGSSSHIAAFVPVKYSSRCCFIREWCGKDHYG